MLSRVPTFDFIPFHFLIRNNNNRIKKKRIVFIVRPLFLFVRRVFVSVFAFRWHRRHFEMVYMQSEIMI